MPTVLVSNSVPVFLTTKIPRFCVNFHNFNGLVATDEDKIHSNAEGKNRRTQNCYTFRIFTSNYLIRAIFHLITVR